MPVYEYEPEDWDCLICDGRFAAIQPISDEPLKFCPHCGMEVRRVVSNVTIKIAGAQHEDRASKKGFTTFRKAESGVWEKIAGEGPDVMAGTREDVEAVKAEKAAAKKVIDLDKSE